MGLKNGEEYIASVKPHGLEAYVMGEKVGALHDHSLVKPSLMAPAATFACAHDEGTRDLFRARSSLSGNEVNRFTHLHQSTEDLMKKVIMQRHCGNITGCCFQRCVGLDAANAVFSMSYECDQKYGSPWHKGS